MNTPLIILSLGAGVQSSTLALMAAHGEITPMPDCAIFADTGAEPRGVYQWLNWLETKLPFPVHRVMEGQGLRMNIIDAVTDGKRTSTPPFFTESTNGGGLLRRQCTGDFKIDPIRKKIRELLGLTKGARAGKEVLVSQWIGISTDEAQRMKPNQDRWIKNRWPLIEVGMTRGHCLEWMRENGYPEPPKSACTFCPYHDDSLWRDMKINDPESFADAIEMDRLIRNGTATTNQKLYLHRSLKPLDQIDFSNAEDMGQGALFGDECEGMCGV